jgi:hypothetical protein
MKASLILTGDVFHCLCPSKAMDMEWGTFLLMRKLISSAYDN